ncbi:hypothetical protein VIBHAR_00842 [Vibrio campbellii ATCC BAA-1116]|uniref:Uncharacterized protein n=1 Tax=Vibrio campbellii (strain ATCC BAA-1116) TaxID=2902295 RepID=A7MWR9_VIBC1|nr:hypothetical protein [Vibrio campbellii]ABU69843.1 hypothetical protein VIBHAR_00842 [Vibrio campbellii ATCC BAA-1116]
MSKMPRVKPHIYEASGQFRVERSRSAVVITEKSDKNEIAMCRFLLSMHQQ